MTRVHIFRISVLWFLWSTIDVCRFAEPLVDWLWHVAVVVACFFLLSPIDFSFISFGLKMSVLFSMLLQNNKDNWSVWSRKISYAILITSERYKRHFSILLYIMIFIFYSTHYSIHYLQFCWEQRKTFYKENIR